MTASKAAPKETVPNDKTKTVRIKSTSRHIGDEQYETTYACSGLHVDEAHYSLLPLRTTQSAMGKTAKRNGRKIEPGINYELPEAVALQYLKSSPRFLEEVYD